MLTLLGNRYQIVQEIGAGAMGRVYQVVDTKTGVAMAAKVMIAGQDESLEMLLRFQQEGAVLSTLRHPNIVTVYGTFLEEGSCSIIMELLEGHSLAEILPRERLSLERVRALGSQTASALGFAHGRGVIHRDVKPSNIMVVGADRVKVTDFGIARVAQGSTLRTATGVSLGTPIYMSPEQIEGGTVDARSDVYSLGAVLFEMVAGRPPFEGRDPLSIAFKHVHTAPPRPSSLNAQVPAAWESLILTSLEKNPSRRFQSADEVARALDDLTLDADSPGTVILPGSVSAGQVPSANTQAGAPASAAPSVSTPVPDPGPVYGQASSPAATLAPPVDAKDRPTRPAWLVPAAGVLAVAVVAAAVFVLHGLAGQSTPGATAQSKDGGSFIRQLAPFDDPEGVAVDAAGNAYVAARNQNQIVKIGPNGNVLARFGSQGSGNGQFDGPTGVAIDSQGNIFVADSANNRIEKLSPSGRWEASWGGPEPGVAPGLFSGVHAVAVDGKGDVYAADYNNNRIVELSPTGTVLHTFGGPAKGTGGGQFDGPVGVAVDANGNIYVADFNNSRVQKLSSTGTFLKQFTSFGNSSGLVRPHGVAVDARGHIYVADYLNDMVEEIDASGQPVHLTGSKGSGEGQFKNPTAVFVDAHGNVYVADSGNKRVEEFAPAGQ